MLSASRGPVERGGAVVFSYPPLSTEVLRLDKEGFVYMGERIKDAGRAYDLFVKTMEELNNHVS